ncbi:MAG: YggS family pyridoxal phosphate-dependent enzyme [Eubacteriales bacterium]|nr:YggS family pyridoxal phosphate-dependent enzyme [Eubacteriales bacterium]
MSVRDNYLRIRENMESACARAGRSVADVTLVGVTKFVEEDAIAEAIDCGLTDVGENRVQEWQRKREFFARRGVRTHLIGQLQTNKVKYIVGAGIGLIQSVDRLALAEALERHCLSLGCTQDVLIEVNIGDEAQKGGVERDELPELLMKISAMSQIRVRGLMCIPPAVGAEDARRYFVRMRELYADTAALALPNVSMRVLSMGMSGDYTVAIEEGATMVRVGTAMFGARI